MENIKCGFENAIIQIYPNCHTITCYHFNRNIWREAKAFNMTGNSEGRNLSRMASYMPLLPSNRISNAWLSIINAVSLTDKIVLFKLL